MATKGSARARTGDASAALSPVEQAVAPREQRPAGADSWHRRYGRLYEELKRPARAMVRRAFGRVFSEQEIEDLYGNAWLGTLRALDRRREELSDDELRRYLLTAVANQASKELRRRGRRPTAPLELARGVPDHEPSPDERAADSEDSQIARDVLGTLPPRRRAVLLFRYGWGLEPHEVCRLIKGLSHRAYRKEITRGVQEVGAKLRLVEQGQWCESREPVLQAYVGGVADDEQRRQAEQHLAHCRPCADYVGKLNGHLHEVGSSVAWTGVADVVGGERIAFADRLGEAADRTRESVAGVFARGAGESGEVVAHAASTGGARGAGVGAAGAMAKLAGLGGVPKLVAACVGTGAAATACVAAGIGPVTLPERPTGVTEARVEGKAKRGSTPAETISPTQEHGLLESAEPGDGRAPQGGGGGDQAAPSPAPDPTPAPAPDPPPAPPVQQEFGLAAGGGGASSTGSWGDSSVSGGSGSGSGGGGKEAVNREFGP